VPQGFKLPSGLPKEPLCMPLDGNRPPVLAAIGAMLSHPLEEIIMVSTEEAIIFKFPLFDIPGVGIMVPMDEEELTSCGCRWF